MSSIVAFLLAVWSALSPTFAVPVHDVSKGISATPKHCKLVWSVTYRDEWGALFIENDYTCRNIEKHKAPVEISEVYVESVKHRDSFSQQHQQQVPLNSVPRTPINKHHIVDYGCVAPSQAKPLDDSGASLLSALGLLANQSCIAPQHLREYREYKRPWSADWAMTNFNGGDDIICDWYTELANVGSALHIYCTESLERDIRDGPKEVWAHGRDSERPDQRWCLRYTDRGWGDEDFEKLCAGLHEA